MDKDEYQYFVVTSKPTQLEIEAKQKEGWEICDGPNGVVGRDLGNEPTYPHTVFYFRKKVKI